MVAKVFTIGWALISLAVIAFIVLVGVGVFTALDSAATVTLSSSKAYGLEEETESVLKNVEEALSGVDFAHALHEETEGDSAIVDINDATDAVPEAEGHAFPSAVGNTTATNPPATTETKKTWHEPEYKTVHHEAVYETRHHEATYNTLTDYYTCCNDCGFKIQGSIYPHQDETGHGRYSTNVPISRQVLVKEAWDETVCVREAWDERVLVKEGYWA